MTDEEKKDTAAAEETPAEVVSVSAKAPSLDGEEEIVAEPVAEEVVAEEPKKDEPKKEEVKAEVKEEVKEEKPTKEVPAKFKDLVKEIENLSVLELAELVKVLEEKFGVSAAAPVAMMAGGAAAAPAEAAEEKTSFDVILAAAGAQKINVIKAVREIKPELGLVDAKNLVEAAPKEVLKGVKKEEADAAKAKLEAAGATVEMK